MNQQKNLSSKIMQQKIKFYFMNKMKIIYIYIYIYCKFEIYLKLK